jgi:hypothetical protein
MKTAVEFLESVEVDKFAKDCIKHRHNSYGENITSETQKLDTIYGFKQGFQKAIELLKQQEHEDILCNCSQGKGIDFDEMGIAYCVSCQRQIN